MPQHLTPMNYQGQFIHILQGMCDVFYSTELRNRSFVTSRITPYSANVHLVLYDCKAGMGALLYSGVVHLGFVVQQLTVEPLYKGQGQIFVFCKEIVLFCPFV